MPTNYTNRRYLDALNQRVLVYDGAMGTSLQRQNLTAEHFGGEQYNGCNDYLTVTYPQAVEQVHRAFLEVGVDVIETCTFRSNPLTLQEYGLSSQTYQINHAAATLARRLADEYSTPEKARFVAGSIGPSGKLPSADDPTLSDITFEQLAENFKQQAIGLIEGGVDVLLIETSQDILEVKAAIHGIQLAFEQTGARLPLQVQVTLDTTGRMLLGTDIAAALTILEGFPIDVIGLNCSTGPDHMREPIRFLGENATLPVSCIPNAGLPLNINGEAVYPLEPEPFAQTLLEFVQKHHISVVGGCCGTTPAHLQKLVQAINSQPLPPRPKTSTPRLASGIRAFTMQQEPAPLLIGERCNAQGSRKFKRLLLAEDWDGIVEIAREQVENGAHALDLSVAVTERADEAALMRTLVRKLTVAGIDAPLVFDTTEPEVMESALAVAPGRSLLNSTHLEAGRAKADKVFSLAKKYNAAVLLLTIDETGMAKTVERKLEIARRLYQIATREHGLQPGDLVYDVLTFTLATGDPEWNESAKATIEGIRAVKTALPGVFTSLGVSNVSFGLSPNARAVLNSVFLYHCVQAGLDMAIVNPAHITPYAEIPAQERTLAEDLIFYRHPNALQTYIAYFEQHTAAETVHTDPTAGMTLAERLHWRILHRHKDGIEADVDALIQSLTPPSPLGRGAGGEGGDGLGVRARGERADSVESAAIHVLNNVLLPAMKEVGDKFGAGELILPFVLQSAETMKKAVARLETYLEKQAGVSKGTIVLATVYGDVHDIGKNLVKTILSNNGFNVIDLGKQVPAETIIRSAIEHNASAIGLSALLVSTSKQMPIIVNELHRRGLNFPVLIGGAAINRRFGRRILFTDTGEAYKPGVFYCKDAFEGLETVESLRTEETRLPLISRTLTEAQRELGRATEPKGDARLVARSATPAAENIPTPPWWGARTVRSIPLEMVFQHLYKNELFRLSWGAKNTHGAAWDKLQAEFEARLQTMQRDALKHGWLQPQAVYGYFACQADGNDLILYLPSPGGRGGGGEGNPSPGGRGGGGEGNSSPGGQNPAGVLREGAGDAVRFTFPRQPDGEHLCLADYFATVDSGKMDVVALQVVTVGAAATERFDALQAAHEYTEAYFFHGLAVQTAEATAEYLHRHIRRELGLPEGQGKRYSWGYPAIPDLDDHEKVFALLPAAAELGMSLSPAYQLIPEQSTAAIILHHPQAKYYTVGESRVEQLMK